LHCLTIDRSPTLTGVRRVSVIVATTATAGCGLFPSFDGFSGAEGAAPFCPSQGTPLICDDFDTEAFPGQRWSLEKQGAHGSYSIDATSAVSPPNELSISVEGVVTNDTFFRFTRSQVPFTGKTEVVYSIDFRADTLPEENEVVLAIVDFPNGSASYQLVLSLKPMNVNVHEYAQDANGTPIPGMSEYALTSSAVPLGGWWSVLIDAVLVGSPSVTVWYGEPGSRAMLFDKQPLHPTTADRMNLNIGIAYAKAPMSAQTVHLDNVVFDIK
jgi:hypothetical protein